MQIEKQQECVNTAAGNIRLCIAENGKYALNQTEYEKHYSAAAERYKSEISKLKDLEEKRTVQVFKKKETRKLLNTLNENNTIISEFDESLFYSLVAEIVIEQRKRIIFKLKDGSEINYLV